MVRYLSYKCVIFDMDNTLYDEKDYFKSVFKEMSIIINKYTVNKNENQIYHEILDEFLIKGSQYPNFFLYITKKYNLDKKYHEIFYNIYKSVNANISLHPDAEYILKWLKSENYYIGLITNGTVDAQLNKIKLLNIDKIVDCICVAREFGKELEKPNTFPYEYVIKKLNVMPHETLYIGDNPINDFQGAKKMGIKTIRIRRGEFKDVEINNEYIDYEIHLFYELKNIIEGLA